MLYWLNGFSVGKEEKSFVPNSPEETFPSGPSHPPPTFPPGPSPVSFRHVREPVLSMAVGGERKTKATGLPWPSSEPMNHFSFPGRWNSMCKGPVALSRPPFPQGLTFSETTPRSREGKELVEFLMWAGRGLLYFSITESSPPGEAMKYRGNGEGFERRRASS